MLDVKSIRNEGVSWQPCASPESGDVGVFASLLEQVYSGHDVQAADRRNDEQRIRPVQEERRGGDESAVLERDVEADVEPGVSEERSEASERAGASAAVSSNASPAAEEVSAEVVAEAGGKDGQVQPGQVQRVAVGEAGQGSCPASAMGAVAREVAGVGVAQAPLPGQGAGAEELVPAGSVAQESSANSVGSASAEPLAFAGEPVQPSRGDGAAAVSAGGAASTLEAGLGQSERDETAGVGKDEPGQEQTSVSSSSAKVELARAVSGVSERGQDQPDEQSAHGGPGKEAPQLAMPEEVATTVALEPSRSAVSAPVDTGVGEGADGGKQVRQASAPVVQSAGPVSLDTASDVPLSSRVEQGADGDAALVRENVEQAVKAVRAAVGRQSSRVQIRLDPPELGYLRIELKQDSGGLRLQLQATTVRAQQLLEQGRQDLQAVLKLQGVPARQIEVQLRLDLRNDQSSDQGQEWSQGRQGRGSMDSHGQNGQQGPGEPYEQWKESEGQAGGWADGEGPLPEPVGVGSGAVEAERAGVGTNEREWQALEFGGLDVQG